MHIQAHPGHTQAGAGPDTDWQAGHMDVGTQIHRQIYTGDLVKAPGKYLGL